MQKKLSLIIILLSSIYFISQFSRASLGVVVIDIAADLNLNSDQSNLLNLRIDNYLKDQKLMRNLCIRFFLEMLNCCMVN